MTTSEHVNNEAAGPVEADLARGEQLLDEVRARIAELGGDTGNAEAVELRRLEPRLIAHNAELRNSVAVIELVGRQIELQEYVRIDGDAPLITRILGFVAMADQRTRKETMATFTARGDKPYTIDDAVMQLYRRGLVRRTRRGVVEAVQDKAWRAIEDETASRNANLTDRVLTMIGADGPCDRSRIIGHFTREGFETGAVDGSLQRLRRLGKVSTVRSGRTSSYTAAEPTAEPDTPEQDAADQSAEG